jgi:hypothetical protein
VSADRLTAEHNEQLREVARRLVQGGRTQADIAIAIGMVPPNFSAFMHRRQGLGLINAVRLLRLAGELPERFFPELAPESSASPSEGHRYPNFVLAGEFARRSAPASERAITERAIERVGAMALHADKDPTPAEWLRQIEAEQIILKREAASQPARAAAEPKARLEAVKGGRGAARRAR